MRRIRAAILGTNARRRLAIVGVVSLTAFTVQVTVAVPAAAARFTGGVSPTIVGGLADLNGDGAPTGRDDANAFYGDTHIIDGALDCDAWGSANDGAAGDGMIDAGDDCTLIGYDGTADGVTIDVVDGEFQVANGPLPTVFNAADPDNPSIVASDFAWSTINGRVDSDGNGVINANDCHFGVIGEADDVGLADPTDGADILGNTQTNTNPCGFGTAPDASDNGKVDLNDDAAIDASDSCDDGCLFGHDVSAGFVLAFAPPECPGFEGDPRNDVIGTPGNDTLVGTPRRDIICAKGGNDTLAGRGRDDLLLGAGGSDLLRGGPGADALRGGRGRDELRGGRGPDDLRGGPGNDRLFGGRGNDHLAGGAGFDLGVGGPGIDTIVGCERRRQ
jgi:Ca2+-binding RTX toxin-like protein